MRYQAALHPDWGEHNRRTSVKSILLAEKVTEECGIKKNHPVCLSIARRILRQLNHHHFPYMILLKEDIVLGVPTFFEQIIQIWRRMIWAKFTTIYYADFVEIILIWWLISLINSGIILC